jgi:hypothetical protein
MTGDSPEIDWERATKGLIPWTSDEYVEVLSFRQKLEEIPKDDWDLRPRRFGIEHEPGRVEMFQFNQLAHENQIGQYISEKYSDRTVAVAHVLRYFEMNWFLRRHQRRFEREGFIRKGHEPGKIEVNDCLFQAVATAPLTRTRGRGRHKHPTFDLAAIIEQTQKLIQDEEGEGEGS